MTRPTKNQRGIALVLTLAILVIATILLVGFATTMRTERQATVSMSNNSTAAILSQTALDHAIALLDKNIPQPIPPGVSSASPINWLINPGLLTTTQGTSPPIQIPLSSGDPLPPPALNAELNIPLLSGLGNTIAPPGPAGQASTMQAAWVPIVRDPTAVGGPTNQIVGRYAFWMDDESAKINLNTAKGKPSAANLDFSKLTPGVIPVGSSTYPLGHPASVNLDMLGQIDTNGLASAVGLQGGLKTVESVKPFLPPASSDAFLAANKFLLSTYGRDPEFNVFGKSRFFPFKKARPLGRPFFQFFRDLEAPMYFHGEEAPAADPASLYYTAASISGTATRPGILSRNDWPGMPARSFVDKWAVGSTPLAAQREADQVAWNILTMGNFADYGNAYSTSTSGDYVKFENKIAAGQAGAIGTVNYPNAAVPLGPLSQKAIVPAFPRPLVNEVSVTLFLEPFSVAGTPKYRLKVWLQTELWLGPGYPACDFGAEAAEVGLTYMSYSVSQVGNPAPAVTQQDTKYIKNGDPDGIRSFFGAKTNGVLPDSSGSRYAVVVTQGAPGQPTAQNKWIYVRNGSGFSSSTTGPFNFEQQGTLHCNFKLRLFEHSPSGSVPKAPPSSLVPVIDKRDPATLAANSPFGIPPPPSPQVPAFAPPADDPNAKDYIEFDFDLNPSTLSNQVITRSLEIPDPRLGGRAAAWVMAPNFNDPNQANADSLGAPNTVTTGWDAKKMAFVDFSNPASSSNRPSIGMFSLVATGMQRGLAGASLNLQPSGNSNELPDWLLLDLFAPSGDADNYADLSSMNSSAGKVSLNASIYPAGAQFNPPLRWQPLQAVFQNMSGASTVGAGATSPSQVVSNVLNHTLAAGGTDFGAPNQYDYLGEVCEIAGVADSTAADWDKEALVRYLASNLSTKTNTFSVWGVAQTVKKNPLNTAPAAQGTFETKATGAQADDTVTGEKRFQAIVERYLWQGNDAIAGNGHVSAAGTYDRLASQPQPGVPPNYLPAPNWENVDGPDAPTYPVSGNSGPWTQNAPASYSASPLTSANNPLRASMKYRVLYFRYLDE